MGVDAAGQSPSWTSADDSCLSVAKTTHSSRSAPLLLQHAAWPLLLLACAASAAAGVDCGGCHGFVSVAIVGNCMQKQHAVVLSGDLTMRGDCGMRVDPAYLTGRLIDPVAA
jgi:hypothetical protein